MDTQRLQGQGCPSSSHTGHGGPAKPKPKPPTGCLWWGIICSWRGASNLCSQPAPCHAAAPAKPQPEPTAYLAPT